MDVDFERKELQVVMQTRLQESRALALLGARQVGKTTLAKNFAATHQSTYFDLEDPATLSALAQPRDALHALLAQGGTVVIDEVQRHPALFAVLRSLIDIHQRPAQFLLLGSASPALLRESGESLAGRLSLLHMGGLSLREMKRPDVFALWLRGGFPRAQLASSGKAAFRWLRDYLSLVVERDLPQIGLNAPASTMQRFWRILANYHGQTWNAAEPARSLGVSEPTVRKYLDFMSGMHLVRQLPPWHENLGKRQVKAPKIYIRDTGLLHYLLGIETQEQLWLHPRCGASWEGFALEQVLHVAQPDEAYFWATHAGAELDLLMFKHGLRVGVEFKRTDSPSMTPSMHIALQDLKLDALYVVYPGQLRYTIAQNTSAAHVQAVPMSDLAQIAADW
jgi:uncharacterized protein